MSDLALRRSSASRVQRWSQGRPVFENHAGKILWVGHSAWMVTDREVRTAGRRTRHKDVAVFSGGAAHLCPGSRGATWWYRDTGRRREDPGMAVLCHWHEEKT